MLHNFCPFTEFAQSCCMFISLFYMRGSKVICLEMILYVLFITPLFTYPHQIKYKNTNKRFKGGSLHCLQQFACVPTRSNSYYIVLLSFQDSGSIGDDFLANNGMPKVTLRLVPQCNLNHISNLCAKVIEFSDHKR